MTPSSSPNLDKLRNIVQKFGASSFTTDQVASEYDDAPATAESIEQFDALLQRDYNLLLGCFLVTAAVAVLFNLLTDLVYTLVDPRIEMA